MTSGKLMDANILLFELGKIADKLDIELRFDSLDTPGGLCTIKGKKLLLINRGIEPAEQADVILDELCRQKGLEDVYVLPGIRKLLDERRVN